MGTNKGLILDMDDTLYSSNDYIPSALKCAVKAMMEVGLPARSSEEAIARLIEIRKTNSNAQDHFNRLCASYEIDLNNQRIIQAGRVAYHDTKHSLIQRREGLLILLDKAKEFGYKSGIVTNGLEDKQWEKLHRLDLTEYFIVRDNSNNIIDDYVFISDKEDIKKPNPTLFNIAIEKMGLDPEKTFSVGDKLDDVIAANRAKIGNVVRLLRGPYKNETYMSYLIKKGYSAGRLKLQDDEIKKKIEELKPHIEITSFFELLSYIK